MAYARQELIRTSTVVTVSESVQLQRQRQKVLKIRFADKDMESMGKSSPIYSMSNYHEVS